MSAQLDGEHEPVEWQAAVEHVRGCAECRAFQDASTDLHRVTRLRPVDDLPDLTPRISAAAGISPRADDPARPVRIVLACTALLQMALALPALLLGDDANLPTHYARHLGSIDVALAIGFLWVARKPARALGGVLPIAAALVLCHVGSSIADVASGRAAPGAELLHHVTELVGLTAMWLLTPRPVRTTAGL